MARVIPCFDDGGDNVDDGSGGEGDGDGDTTQHLYIANYERRARNKNRFHCRSLRLHFGFRITHTHNGYNVSFGCI